jgi:hypothetical protein
MILNVVLHVLYMVVYSYVINPGQEASAYQAHAEFSAPYSSIVGGVPLMFLAGRWIGGRVASGNSTKAALLVWLVYFLIDITVVTIAGALAELALLLTLSYTSKLAAAYLGGRMAQQRKAQ